jgi:hypothetical protein
MHTYIQLERLPAPQFKRLTGVSRTTFATMLEILEPVLTLRQSHGGPRFRNSIEDMLLMALTYWREYRTYFHLGNEYGLSESQCFKVVTRIENILIKDKRFHIQGKKTLLFKPKRGSYVTVDVAESPIERPQKKGEKTSRNITILGKRSAIRSKLSFSLRKEEPLLPLR